MFERLYYHRHYRITDYDHCFYKSLLKLGSLFNGFDTHGFYEIRAKQAYIHEYKHIRDYRHYVENSWFFIYKGALLLQNFVQFYVDPLDATHQNVHYVVLYTGIQDRVSTELKAELKSYDILITYC